MNLLTWEVARRGTREARERPLPPAVVTLGPRFRHDSLPDEVGLLLPNSEGGGALISAVRGAPGSLGGAALGLFLADPFLNVAGEAASLRGSGVDWVANLPSVEQQDLEFTQQLEDVGLDFAQEVERLSLFRRQGFRLLAVVSSAAAAARVAPLDPEAIFVIPRVADFAAGFPSLHQRGAVAREIAQALRGHGCGGALLGLAAPSEMAHETLWPRDIDGVVCRPRPADLPGLSP